MNKTFGALAIAATLAVATVAIPRRRKPNAIGCAFAGGVVAGALITNAAAHSRPYGAYYAADRWLLPEEANLL